MKNHNDILQLAERIDAQLRQDDMYRKENMEYFGLKWHEWLRNEIRNKLEALQVWVDDSLVENIRRFLVERGFFR